jgi:hypothetical protein
LIVSASRRTDIPALYGPWLCRRIETGYAEVPHPFDPARIRRVGLRPPPAGEMAALVLWTRNPGPVLEQVPIWEAAGIRSLWLVTVTGYPRELEPDGPNLETAVRSMRRLAELVGRERISWRYDPVLFCPRLGMDPSWHRRNFERLTALLAGCAERCIVSVYDDYAKSRRRLGRAGYAPDLETDPIPTVADLATLAAQSGVVMQSCCETLEPAGVSPGGCIDGPLLDRLWDLDLGSRADPGQRPGCRCAPSVDIGVYTTCTHGCLYCYATGAIERARQRRSFHDSDAERLA